MKGNTTWANWVDEEIQMGVLTHPLYETDSDIEEIGRKLCWQVQSIDPQIVRKVGKAFLTPGNIYALSVFFWIEPVGRTMPAISSFPRLEKSVFDTTADDIHEMVHLTMTAIKATRDDRLRLLAALNGPCEKHEVSNCSLCKPQPPVRQFRSPADVAKLAEFESECVRCEQTIFEGDPITNIDGDWIHRVCP